MPPTVNTAFAKEIGGEIHGMQAGAVAEQLIRGIEHNDYEIYPGKTQEFRQNFFAGSSEAFQVLNQGVTMYRYPESNFVYK